MRKVLYVSLLMSMLAISCYPNGNEYKYELVVEGENRTYLIDKSDGTVWVYYSKGHRWVNTGTPPKHAPNYKDIVDQLEE